MLKRIILTAFFLLMMTARSSWSYDILEGVDLTERKDFPKGTIAGMGAILSTKPYIDVDEDVYPVPIIVAEYKAFFIDGDSAGYSFYQNDSIKFSAVFEPRLMGYEDDDSPVLAGMEDRDWSLDGGLKFEWKNDWFEMDLTGVNDLLENHEGQEAKIVFSKEFLEGFLTPRIGVNWLSDDLVDYYYGVTAAETTGARPAYNGDSTINYLTGVTIGIPLGDQWAVILDYEYEWLGDEIQDSPIVDAKETQSYLAGVVYRF